MPSIEERHTKNEEKLATLKIEQQQAINRVKERFNKQMDPLKKSNKDILKAEKKAARDARTHRLVQNGALAEQYLHCEDLPPPLFQEYLDALIRHRLVRQALVEMDEIRQALLARESSQPKNVADPSGVKESDSKSDDVTHR